MIRILEYRYDLGHCVYAPVDGYFEPWREIDINENLIERVRKHTAEVRYYEMAETSCKVFWFFNSTEIDYRESISEHECYTLKMCSGDVYYVKDLPKELEDLLND